MNILPYQKIQHLAKKTLNQLIKKIKIGMSAADIEDEYKAILCTNHIKEYWYYNKPIMIAIGNDTLLSQSGKEYQSSTRRIAFNDFITIDLSIAIDGYWGIYAKSFVIEEGVVKFFSDNCHILRYLQKVTYQLHDVILDLAHPDMTFHELYHLMISKIKNIEVKHLDFKNNFGHSIEKKLDDRLYIQDQVDISLGSKNIFSFEPHLCLPNKKYGYKYADIYYFSEKKLHRLSD